MLPKSCPDCKASDDKFLKKGIGTQKVVTILEKMSIFQLLIDNAYILPTYENPNQLNLFDF